MQSQHPARGSRLRVFPAAALLALVWGMGSPAPPARAALEVFVNTTEDLAYEASLCLPGKACSLRAALGRIEGRSGVVRACYDPAEVGGEKRCPPGWMPLRHADPGYDAARGKWVFQIGAGRPPFEVASNDNVLDFTLDVQGWDGPADNRIVVDSGLNLDLNQAFSLERAANNTFKGFEVTGSYVLAAIELSGRSSGNQLGPGMIVSGITSGVGIRLMGAEVVGNRVVGSWCGITGDGTRVSPVADDCVQIRDGAKDNVIGGTDAAARNVFAASELGVAVSVSGSSFDNRVEGNWLGLNGAGEGADVNLGGLRIDQGAHGTQVAGNVIGGNRGPGILLADDTWDVVVRDNFIGSLADGLTQRPNRDYGIRLLGLPKGTAIRHNKIAYNRAGGVYITGSSCYNNTVSENSITQNRGPALQVLLGANGGVQPPAITLVSASLVQGRTCAGCRVEVFSDPADQADVLEGVVTAGPDGLFVLNKAAGFRFGNLTATASEGKNTSGLSASVAVPGPVEPTATPPLPAATATPDPLALKSLWLPWLGRAAERR